MSTVDSLTIAVETDDAGATRNIVLDGLRAFNREHAEAPAYATLVLAARDEAGQVVAGLTGETAWRWLHVHLLWVAPPFRRAGLGRRLLRAAEAEAIQRGCLFAHLDTFDFQARPFYEREGYEVFGVQRDYPPGHDRFYLRKSLSRSST